mmetsp:Transcript_66497/g.105694  ORF Transcript_66497/g.105694 Transcript_66497/m.105694 type:complete len:163 (-) Transcript_66497:36-524(-)
MSHAEGEPCPLKDSYREIAISDYNIAALDTNGGNKFCIKCAAVIEKASQSCPRCNKQQPANPRLTQRRIIVKPVHNASASDLAEGREIACLHRKCRRRASIHCQKCATPICSYHSRIHNVGGIVYIYCKNCSRKHSRNQCVSNVISVLLLVLIMTILIAIMA